MFATSELFEQRIFAIARTTYSGSVRFRSRRSPSSASSVFGHHFGTSAATGAAHNKHALKTKQYFTTSLPTGNQTTLAISDGQVNGCSVRYGSHSVAHMRRYSWVVAVSFLAACNFKSSLGGSSTTPSGTTSSTGQSASSSSPSSSNDSGGGGMASNERAPMINL